MSVSECGGRRARPIQSQFHVRLCILVESLNVDYIQLQTNDRSYVRYRHSHIIAHILCSSESYSSSHSHTHAHTNHGSCASYCIITSKHNFELSTFCAFREEKKKPIILRIKNEILLPCADDGPERDAGAFCIRTRSRNE